MSAPPRKNALKHASAVYAAKSNLAPRADTDTVPVEMGLLRDLVGIQCTLAEMHEKSSEVIRTIIMLAGAQPAQPSAPAEPAPTPPAPPTPPKPPARRKRKPADKWVPQINDVVEMVREHTQMMTYHRVVSHEKSHFVICRVELGDDNKFHPTRPQERRRIYHAKYYPTGRFYANTHKKVDYRIQPFR